MKRMIAILVCFVIIVVPCTAIKVDACLDASYPWRWHSSVDTSQLSVKMCSTAYSNVVSSGVFQSWDYITDNINVISYSPSSDNASYTADINFFHHALDENIYALTYIYTQTTTGVYSEIDVSRTTASTRIIQCRIQLGDQLLGSASGYLNQAIKHELGHALSLGHPYEFGCTSQSIMQLLSTGYSSSTLTTHDRQNIINKWEDL